MTRKVAVFCCEGCGAKVPLTLTKKGRLTYNCTAAGCGWQVFSRSEATDRRLAAKAEGWTDSEVRAQLAPDPKPEPARPAPAPSPARKPGLLDRPLF